MSRKTLKPYQNEALNLIVKLQGKAGLFMAPGTGKTVVAIQYGSRFKRVLVVCRREDFLTWQEELKSVGQPAPYCVQTAKDLEAKKVGDSKWVMVTYGMTRNKKMTKLVGALRFNCCIADESQNIKRWAARQTKCLIKNSRIIPRRIAMSGTPIGNDIQDIWSQAKFIDDGAVFGSSWWDFMNRYFIKLRPPAPPTWILKAGAHELIMAKLKKIAMHVHEDDVLKLPPICFVVKSFEPSPEQKRVTKQLLEDWEYELGQGKPVDINHVVVQVSKLRQVAGGFLYPPKIDGKTVGKTRYLECPKLKYLASLVNDDLKHKPKIVIWAAFAAEIELIKRALSPKSKCVTYYGKNREMKREARKQFLTMPKVRVFIGQADSGVGMNELIGADTGIYYSNSTRVVSRLQSERRIRRIGSEKHQSITYYDLITEGSPDGKIHTSLKNNQDIAKTVLSAIKLNRGQALINLVTQ